MKKYEFNEGWNGCTNGSNKDLDEGLDPALF